jgi:hypothetical protein
VAGDITRLAIHVIRWSMIWETWFTNCQEHQLDWMSTALKLGRSLRHDAKPAITLTEGWEPMYWIALKDKEQFTRIPAVNHT